MRQNMELKPNARGTEKETELNNELIKVIITDLKPFNVV